MCCIITAWLSLIVFALSCDGYNAADDDDNADDDVDDNEDDDNGDDYNDDADDNVDDDEDYEDEDDDDYDNSHPGGVVSQGSLTVPPTKPLVDLMTGPAIAAMIRNCYHDDEYMKTRRNADEDEMQKYVSGTLKQKPKLCLLFHFASNINISTYQIWRATHLMGFIFDSCFFDFS